MIRRPRPCPATPARPAIPAGGSGLAAPRHSSGWTFQRRGPASVPLLALIAAALLWPAAAVRAGVRFENCVQGSDGSISCDTVPTGNTYLNDKDAQYGLLQQASPGWAEFNPYQGYDEDFGGGDD